MKHLSLWLAAPYYVQWSRGGASHAETARRISCCCCCRCHAHCNYRRRCNNNRISLGPAARNVESAKINAQLYYSGRVSAAVVRRDASNERRHKQRRGQMNGRDARVAKSTTFHSNATDTSRIMSGAEVIKQRGVDICSVPRASAASRLSSLVQILVNQSHPSCSLIRRRSLTAGVLLNSSPLEMLLCVDILHKAPTDDTSMMGVLHQLNTCCISLHSRAVLTNGYTEHVPRPPDFFLFGGPPTGCGEIIFLKLIIVLPSQRSTVRETR